MLIIVFKLQCLEHLPSLQIYTNIIYVLSPTLSDKTYKVDDYFQYNH